MVIGFGLKIETWQESSSCPPAIDVKSKNPVDAESEGLKRTKVMTEGQEEISTY